MIMTIPDFECMMENGSIEQRCTPEEESRVIRDLTKKAESNPREGDTYYLLSTRWYVSWQEYSTGKPDNTPAERPGPIDNADLVSEGHDPQLLRTIEERRNYVLLPEEAWGRLHEWYKGGPAIARKMITVGERKEFRIEVFPLCLNLIDSRDQSHSVIRLSRKASLNELYEAVCQLKGLEPDKVRIFDYFNWRKLTTLVASDQTLEDSNLEMDQHILLELQDDGSWPSRCFEMVSRPFRSFSIAGGLSDVDMDGCEQERNVTRRDRRGLAGLHNLGNTCFMNSSIQCLAHTPPIMEYFLKDYGDEINRENPLGMRGELAVAFGDLLRKLWSGRASVPPRAFKQKLAHFAPQFGGYNQHDSQELLAFLLDGLHEDLNRVKQKPYIETKDSDGRPDEEVADEYWSNHKARNDSIIVDVCQGQYKSTLVCPSCSKTSITFDPFMYLSLPLPSKAKRIMTVTVFSGDGSGLPVQYTVTVPKRGSCKDLIEALATECCLGTDEYLLLAEVYMHKVYRYLEDSDELEDIKDDEFLVAYRLPKRCMNFTRLVIIHRFLQKSIFDHPRPRFLLQNPIFDHPMAGERKLFLTPLVTFLEDPQSSSDIDQAVARVLAPFSPPAAQNPNELISSGPGTGPEDMSMESSATEESSGSKLSFHLCLMNDIGGCLPISRETPLKFGRVVKVVLDWTERDHELYDAGCLEALPAVHKTEPNAEDTKPEAISLLSCLDAFLKEEPLGPDDMWYCPECKEHRQATKKLDLWRLPDVLVFHLKRFSYNRWMKNKLDILVDFPVRNLDLSDYVNSNEEGGDNVYELYAISNHYGGLGGGHYSAHCKLINGDNKWYHFDDSKVSQVSEDDITTSAAYVLFYRRVGSKPNGTDAESLQS